MAAFDNLTMLQQTLGRYLIKADISEDSATFIKLFELRADTELLVMEMLKDDTGNVVDGTADMPADYLATEYLQIDTSPPIVPDYTPPQRFFEGTVTAGIPRRYTVAGGKFHFRDTGDFAYTLSYYARLPPLLLAEDTNWLLTTAPNLYLYGSLLEAEPYNYDDARAQIWLQYYERALKTLMATDERKRYRPGAAQHSRARRSERSFGYLP